MSQLITDADWADFKNAMDDAHNTFNQKTIKWFKYREGNNIYGEEIGPSEAPVELKVLVNANYMRTWPSTIVSETGETDEESTQLFINKEYLRLKGYLTPANYFDYDPANDRFEIDGLMYKPFGDTGASQFGSNNSDDVHILIILKRITTPTGKAR